MRYWVSTYIKFSAVADTLDESLKWSGLSQSSVNWQQPSTPQHVMLRRLIEDWRRSHNEDSAEGAKIYHM